MIATAITLWFILGILGVALDFSNPSDDDPDSTAGRILAGLSGPFWFVGIVLWLVLTPASARKTNDKENL